MAKQDDWKRITLRIPPDLYDRIAEAAGAASVNAEIVRRLEESLSLSPSSSEEWWEVVPPEHRAYIQKRMQAQTDMIVSALMEQLRKFPQEQP